MILEKKVYLMKNIELWKILYSSTAYQKAIKITSFTHHCFVRTIKHFHLRILQGKYSYVNVVFNNYTVYTTYHCDYHFLTNTGGN